MNIEFRKAGMADAELLMFFGGKPDERENFPRC